MKLFRTNEIDTDTYQVNDVISFNLTDGERVEAMAVKPENDGMIFVLVDCLSDEYPMNEIDTTYGGYKASDLREKLNNEILERFPDKIRKNMIAFENGDLLRLPTEREIFGDNPYGANEPKSVKQWKQMKDRRNRIAYQGSKSGTWGWYWLQNKVYSSTATFTCVGSIGDVCCIEASYPMGVRPAFKI